MSPTSRLLLITEAEEIASVLKECCDAALAATILPLSAQAHHRAFFSGFGDDDLVLTTEEDAEAPTLAPLSLCFVSFYWRHLASRFDTHVREVSFTAHPGRTTLIVDAPSRITCTDPRRSFRVPLLGEHGLKAEVELLDGGTLAAVPLNISMAGILLSFPGNDDPSLGIGARLRLRIGLEGRSTEVTGQVRHGGHGRYGFLIEESVRDGEVTPPATWGQIVSDVERRWLRHKGG